VNVISSAPSRIEGNHYRLAGILAAIGIAAAAVAGGLFATLGSDGNSTSASHATHTSVLQSLTPQELNARLGEIGAAFGTGHVQSALQSLTPQELNARLGEIGAAFGTGHVQSALQSLTPQERRHVEAITSLTPAQLAAGAAGFGTGQAPKFVGNVTPDDRAFARGTSFQGAQAQPDASRIPLSQGELPSGVRHGLPVEAPSQSTPPQITTGGALAN
jgi:hypothetical protein